MLEPDPELAVVYGIFSVSQASDAGFRAPEIRRLLRKGTWHRSGRGVLAVAGRQSESGDALVRAYLAAGPDAVVGFQTAASLHGWELGRLTPTPTMILPPGVHTFGTTKTYRAVLTNDEVVLRGLVRVTSPLRSALDLAGILPLEQGVITLDAALRSRQVSLDELALAAAVMRRKGARDVRLALDLADEASGSIPESEARLLFRAAGLPPPITQHVVRYDDQVMRLDFAWPEAMVLAEIDGRRWHIDAEAFQTDRTKQNALEQAGWIVLRFTVADVRFRPDYVIGQIQQALGR